jgi:hypothetical protein
MAAKELRESVVLAWKAGSVTLPLPKRSHPMYDL